MDERLIYPAGAVFVLFPPRLVKTLTEQQSGEMSEQLAALFALVGRAWPGEN